MSVTQLDSASRQLAELAVSNAKLEAVAERPALRLSVVERPASAQPEPTPGPLEKQLATGAVTFGPVLFPTGEAALTDSGKNVLIHVADELRQAVASLPGEDDWVVRVEGHTDSQPPLGIKWTSNWELSAARASSVTEFLVQQGFEPKRIMAVGYADTRQVAEGVDPEAMQQNRRTEILLSEP